MAVTYGFYNSLNKDRVYNAEQMSSIFNGIITDGVFASIGGSLMPIVGTGMQVVVKTGKCWFNGTWTQNDAPLPLDIPAADVSLTRIDAVIVEINSAISTRANAIKVVKGTPSANPEKPSLANTETLHQYALGYVTVSAGATSITADKIEINVGKATCPFITSVLQQTDITTLFNQWDAEFNTWFANIQSQLSGDIAANLQRQIDEIRKESKDHLKTYTKTLFGLPESSGPDDAFLALYVGIGKYAYRIKVRLHDGTPVSGATISGISAVPGQTLTTGDDGIVLGVSSNRTVNINCTSPYFDQRSPGTITVNSTGTITDVIVTLENITDIIKIPSSRTVYRNTISKFVKTIDIAGVNGGQNGGITSSCTGGAGGSSGYTKKVSLPNEKIQFVIGSARTSESTSENETYAIIDGIKHTFSTKHPGMPQTSGYPGGYGSFNGNPGSSGYHIFDEQDLEIVGSSGGAGGAINNFTFSVPSNTTAHGGAGGTNAGNGGSSTYISTKEATSTDGTSGHFYGCGGGGASFVDTDSTHVSSDSRPGNGSGGAMFVRFNF